MNRDEFMELVYDELASDPDNNRANRIIEAADEYAESMLPGVPDTTSDTISRQAAIDALSYCQTYLFDLRDDDKKISLEDAEYAIEQLPSATCGNLEKPERPQHSEGEAADCNLDCISRQAAIDAVHKDYDSILDFKSDGATVASSVEDILESLLSVQPETSTDTISRQAALSCFHDWIDKYGDVHEPDEMPEYRAIENLPAVQPERKTGKWIPVDSFSAFGGDEELWMAHGNPVAFYYCSNCKEQAYAGEDGQSLITDYCPNCGAKMEVSE